MEESPSYQELENRIKELEHQLAQNSYAQDVSHEEEGLAEVESFQFIPEVLNSIGDPFFIKDNQSRIIIANDALCNVFQLPRNQIIGQTLAGEVNPKQREKFLAADKKILAYGKEAYDVEKLTINGSDPRVILTRKSLYVNKKGTKFIVGVIHDITEMKKVESQLTDLNATKDHLFSIIAHDLRSPFHGVSGLSDLLLKALKQNDCENSLIYAELNNQAIKKTLVLLDNLLHWASSQIGKVSYTPKKVDLYKLIQGVVDLSKTSASAKNISIHTSLVQVELETDENMVAIVMRNLISNAIKFTPNGGEIEINSSSTPEFIVIKVIDNGVGMSPHVSAQLFSNATNKPTYGTAREKGSGLGLALCKEFVQRLGGDICVQSSEGKGSEFSFSIPY